MSSAKKAARDGPVLIADRGRTAHVLLTFDEYQTMVGKRKSILDLLAMPDADRLEFEPPRLGDSIIRPADFE